MQDLRKEAKGWIADLDARESALKVELLDLLRKERKSEVEAVASAAKKDAAAKADAEKTGRSGCEESRPRKKTDEKKTDKKTSGRRRGETAGGGEGQRTRWLTRRADKPKRSRRSSGRRCRFQSLGRESRRQRSLRPSSNPLHWKRIEQLAFLLTWSLFGIGLCLMLGLFTRPAALAGAGFMLFVVLSQPSYPGVYPLDPPQLGHALLVNKDFVEMVALLVIASTCAGTLDRIGLLHPHVT